MVNCPLFVLFTHDFESNEQTLHEMYSECVYVIVVAFLLASPSATSFASLYGIALCKSNIHHIPHNMQQLSCSSSVVRRVYPVSTMNLNVSAFRFIWFSVLCCIAVQWLVTPVKYVIIINYNVKSKTPILYYAGQVKLLASAFL